MEVSNIIMHPLPQMTNKGERKMAKAKIGDFCVIGGAGAYCSSMCTQNYNSYPAAAEVMLMSDGSIKLIRRRQTLAQILENEVRDD